MHYTLSSKKKSIKLPVSGSANTGKDWLIFTKWLSDNLREIFQRVNNVDFSDVEEIRLRIGQPLLLKASEQDIFLDSNGQQTSQVNSYRISQSDLAETLERMTNSSIYAVNEKLKQGFLTLPGGYRVGIAGQVIMQGEDLQTIKNISALNFRLAKEIKGRAIEVLPLLMEPGGLLRHTLILSAPRAGKTTFLRDLIRSLSEGVPQMGFNGLTVGVVDERGELAGMWQGSPSFDLGPRTDVLDSCSKARGISMLVRTMAPDVIAVDELGHSDDVSAIADALRTGVRILGTAHANTMEEASKRPILKLLLEERFFERIIVLNRKNGPGTIESVFDTGTGRNIMKSEIMPGVINHG
ncbi:MAG: stage III sporulation protein AA [Desulfitobacteriaceae bacterium]|nr:stage III sporulation protein AA [Desulfitobacteriaceae bacterium]MDD4346840.1 stage III sporulation protein AA [Desulfitobacteriaceae bacterium]MDD4401059.1 stage III sporulation protein AA [Desulfitobacteriaceae bacterium]